MSRAVSLGLLWLVFSACGVKAAPKAPPPPPVATSTS